MAKRGSISLIVKGPIKSAKRAGARHGVHMESCRVVSTGNAEYDLARRYLKFGDVQCYAPCKPKTNDGVAQWYGSNARSKEGRGFPPGTLLYHGAMCSKDLSGAKPRKRRK
jgi:hypothetical protein